MKMCLIMFFRNKYFLEDNAVNKSNDKVEILGKVQEIILEILPICLVLFRYQVLFFKMSSMQAWQQIPRIEISYANHMRL